VLQRLFGTGPTAPETDVPTLARERAAGTVQIVDVREPDEWAGGHIPGAVLIPLGQLGFRKGQLDPARPVVVVCRSGRRSLTGAEILLRAGFRDARSLVGGMVAWAGAGQPVAR
jgi:rhodanese-related sulfurtransferase